MEPNTSTPEEFIAQLRVLRRRLIADNGFVYVRDWDFQLLDEIIAYFEALKK